MFFFRGVEGGGGVWVLFLFWFASGEIWMIGFRDHIGKTKLNRKVTESKIIQTEVEKRLY